jgi:Ser/Thr protein kinase RdoA (MazF antagonist)
MGDEILIGGDVSRVVRVGDTVRRPTGPWTPAVHAFLIHLRKVGFSGAPEVLGIDEHGREVFRYIPGQVATDPIPEWAAADDVVESLGVFIREFHEAARSFTAPSDAIWQRWPGAPRSGDFVIHWDITTSNVIWRSGRPIALIDFDFARPAPALFDLATAAKFWCPLFTEERRAATGWPDVDPFWRLRELAEVYGLDEDQRRALPGFIRRKQEMGLQAHRAYSDEGHAAFKAMVHAGGLTRIAADLEWFDEHRAQVERALAG